MRRSVDAVSFSVRFTPRKSRSIWSRVNVVHAERLIATGRMTKAGHAAFEARVDGRTGIYSFEQRRAITLSPAFAKRFRAEKTAWAYYAKRPPWYRRTTAFWVMSAKREATREQRLGTLIACSARGQPIPQLARGP